MDSPKPPAPANAPARWRCKPGRRPAPQGPRRKPGDSTPLTEAQRELAAAHMPLAVHLAGRIGAFDPSWADEFEGAACLALVEAARSFDPARGIRFSTFARYRIIGALVDAGRGLDPAVGMAGRDAADLLSGPVGAEIESVDQVEHWLRKLPARHAEVCRMHYLGGKDRSEIAEAFECSPANVSRLHLQALELLSEAYDADGKRNVAAWRRRKSRGSAMITAGNF